jgi:hypothetical protein
MHEKMMTEREDECDPKLTSMTQSTRFFITERNDMCDFRYDIMTCMT